jgi:ribose 5-phosphate isomerase A
MRSSTSTSWASGACCRNRETPWQGWGMAGCALVNDGEETARNAAAAAAVERIDPGMTIGLGSGRAVWRVIEKIAERFGERPPIRAAFASNRTAELAQAAGIAPVTLDGQTRLDLAIDGADEIDPVLGLLKGGGGALLREKIVVACADRFVVVAEERKCVDHLGQTFRLPVEVVRFGWPETRKRVLALLPSAELRRRERDEPYVTDEGHLLLDCELPQTEDLGRLAAEIKGAIGVVDHGLFLGMADEVLLGRPDGSVDVRRV